MLSRLGRPRRILFAALALVLSATAFQAVSNPAWTKGAEGTNPVTPGNFTGYGFDQCLAPTQKAMNTWLNHSPFLAVGIYISGDSRACRSQPNLTPKWIKTQLRKGWRLLPITLGPQASCQPRFPRYNDDVRINPQPGKKGKYGKARKMGRAEGTSAVAAAKNLGIVPGSTLWYDLEGFDLANTHCRESALAFVSGWTSRMHELKYVSGVYSSAGSGIKALDDARVQRPKAFNLPDQIWLARWDGVANTSTSYIRSDGWRPGGRVKQYLGGHNETWGGVTINIDSNYLDLGTGSVAPRESRCGGTQVNFRDYTPLSAPAAGKKQQGGKTKALQCLLKEKDLYGGKIHGKYSKRVTKAVSAWQTQRGVSATGSWTRRDWMSLHAVGQRPVLKFGSTGFYVRRIQRALNAAGVGSPTKISGVFDSRTTSALKAYQSKLRLGSSGVTNRKTWKALQTGRR